MEQSKLGDKLPKWGPVTAIVGTIAAYITSQLILIEPIIVLALFFNIDVENAISDSAWLQLSLTGLTSVVMLFVIWAIIKLKKAKLSDLGFSKLKIADIGWVIVGAIIYLVALTVVLSLASLIPGYNANEVQEIGYDNAAGWQLLLAFVGLVVVPPLAEEMLFRGFLYRGLASKWPKIWAAIFSSALFALAHMQWNVGIDVFVLSLVLIFVYEKTKNLWSCIILHALKNLTAFLVIFVIQPI